MMKEIRILSRHGIQYIKDLRNQPVSLLFRGKPVIDAGITVSEIGMLHRLCPSGAVDANSGSVDLGKCVFCRECAFALPGRVKFLNDYRIAANRREDLVIKPGSVEPLRLHEGSIRPVIRKVFRNSLKLRQVSAGGDNSSEMELNASGNVNFDLGRYGIEFVASPRHADGIVITSPVSANMSCALEMTYEAVPLPKVIFLAGTDAISGGMFSGSPAVERMFTDSHHIDLYLPGNPVHPLTYINGVMDLLGIK